MLLDAVHPRVSLKVVPMPSKIIDDGYTTNGHIAPKLGIHEGLTFRYRPFSKRSYAAVTDKIRAAKNDEAAELVMAEAIAGQLCEWDAVTGNGNPAPVTKENVSRLPPMLSVSLIKIVTGEWASDEKPEPRGDEGSAKN